MLALINFDQEHHLLKTAVRSAGKIALKYYGTKLAANRKADGSLISEADLEVNNFLKNALLLPSKDYAWLSEESEQDSSRHEKEKVWIIDPIDGTRSFLQNKPEWTISAALLHKGIPVCAAVFNPVTEEFFEAQLGKGAKRNNTLITVSKTNNIEKSNISIPKRAEDLIIQNTELRSANRIWINSIAYRLCLLSTGKIDIVLSRSGASDWDIAAAFLIVQEAGGTITTFQGEEVVFNRPSIKHKNLIITNNILHKKLIKICQNIEF